MVGKMIWMNDDEEAAVACVCVVHFMLYRSYCKQDGHHHLFSWSGALAR
jgi:hypothetical protein